MGGISQMTGRDIRQLSDQAITDIKTPLTRAKFTPEDSRMVLEALKKAENVMRMSNAEVNTWINSLGNLKSFVMEDDVPRQALSDTTINSTISDNKNLLASRGLLSKKV
ncbi:hypothetical protein SK128_022417 [Halocaridina rubra]|uniref:Uncharacterized protein n=1 Tax=Halocaridina rubra TaxID=373956 RepID=A0AAN8X2N4_HALRR